ncbi:sulfite exporter TauE/SafE family protein [Crenothrix sp.]|uniref:sulfite exporter TauE/SafE family protein n=1 Tax=Crenothrix sp. TaxID=3100433 RepID=UPI00374DC1AC
MTTIFIASLLLGTVSGVSAGLFGIGGGLIIVPVLVILFTQQNFAADLVMIMSVATSLATIIFTSISSVWAHHRLSAVAWDKVLRLGPGIIIGSVLGAIVADQMPKELLRLVFVVYLLYAAITMALASKPKPSRKTSSVYTDSIAGIITGCLSAILGIGGGTLIVPFLVYFQMPMRNAVAVASACGLPIAVASTVSYILLGKSALSLPEWSIGYVYLPAFLGIVLTSVFTAPLGAKLANKIPAQQLKRYFSVLLFVMVVKLLWPYCLSLSVNMSSLLHL